MPRTGIALSSSASFGATPTTRRSACSAKRVEAALETDAELQRRLLRGIVFLVGRADVGHGERAHAGRKRPVPVARRAKAVTEREHRFRELAITGVAIGRLLRATAEKELDFEVTPRAVTKRELGDAELRLVLRLHVRREAHVAEVETDRPTLRAGTVQPARHIQARLARPYPAARNRHRCSSHQALARKQYRRAGEDNGATKPIFMVGPILHTTCHGKPPKTGVTWCR